MLPLSTPNYQTSSASKGLEYLAMILSDKTELVKTLLPHVKNLAVFCKGVIDRYNGEVVKKDNRLYREGVEFGRKVNGFEEHQFEEGLVDGATVGRMKDTKPEYLIGYALGSEVRDQI